MWSTKRGSQGGPGRQPHREVIPVSICTFQPSIDFIQQQKAIIKEHALSATAKGDARTYTAIKRLQIADFAMQSMRENPGGLLEKRLGEKMFKRLTVDKLGVVDAPTCNRCGMCP